MDETPTSSRLISFFFNVSLYLYTTFGLELSSSFQNLPVTERIDEFKKLLNLLKDV